MSKPSGQYNFRIQKTLSQSTNIDKNGSYKMTGEQNNHTKENINQEVIRKKELQTLENVSVSVSASSSTSYSSDNQVKQLKLDDTESNSSLYSNKVFRTRKSSGKHQMAACCSCKKRRKKCDGQYPVCNNCKRFGTECTMIYAPNGKEIRRDYLETLENSIKTLKDKVLHLESTTSEISFSSSPDSAYEDQTVRYPPTLNKEKDLAQEVGFISLGAAGESCYIGETSAYSIAKVISSSINCIPVATNTLLDKTSSVFIFELPFRFPSLETANGLLLCYKTSVHCQYPFLDWPFIEKCFNLIIKEKGQDPIANFFIFMIFAISSQIQDVSNNKASSSYTKSYYEKAFETVEKVIGLITIHTVQAYLLMAVFSQKMPDGVSGWQAVGLAIRTAVVLGLHRKSYHKKNEPITNEIRMLQDLKSRIFWSAYGIERINGLVLGRPFSISDIDIDAPFPIETVDTKVGCHVVKLRRIQSSICTFIYKPIQLLDKPEDVDATRVEILLELNDWMAKFPYKEEPSSTFETNNWSLISYHNSILLLLRPIILEVAKSKENSPKRYLEWFKVFTESASAVCINYKNMHLKRKMSYTWLAMHCCFVSGISFLYCIWLDRSLKVLKWKRKSLVYETISSCQTILYVLAERWESASRFRDSFERLSTIVNSYIDSTDDKACDNMDDILTSGVFIDGSIEIDSYLIGRNFKDKFKHRSSIGGETDGISTPYANGFSTSTEPSTSNSYDFLDCDINNDKMDSLWEFLDTTGDKYLRDLFNEMEDSINLNSI
ncbi:hypothetical protein C6P40_001650 [Pichia californica]|uniref:Zn(2)-C6 fungal-type domain-containing protein n=1 Tax=Pichia californica TaxID=460514 RepID=A0A9P7BHI6_9ASCO|nr:hypothetical protein C6P42_000048 [[Candida] californica]KAG0691366.1 hypothetical protein C6P40_001650 [[Candida] californica]